jgi:hypothetical protein
MGSDPMPAVLQKLHLEFIGETQAEDVGAEAQFTKGAEVTGEVIFCAGEDGQSYGVAVVA